MVIDREDTPYDFSLSVSGIKAMFCVVLLNKGYGGFATAAFPFSHFAKVFYAE